MRTSMIEVGGRRIAVHESSGSSHPVVLLHGNSLSGRAFLPQLDGPLGTRFHLVAPDLPGHGLSEAPRAGPSWYSIPEFASAVVEIAGKMLASRAVFVGWSLGGHVLLEALPRLHQAAGVMLMGTPPLATPSDLGAAFLRDPALPLLFQERLSEEEVDIWLAGMVRPGGAAPGGFRDDLLDADPAMRSALLRSLGTVGFADEVAIARGLQVPLAVVLGEHDCLVARRYVATLQLPRLWRGELQIIEGAGHSPHWEATGAFDSLLSAFVGDCLGVA